jgi:sulfur carrier protein ThiS
MFKLLKKILFPWRAEVDNVAIAQLPHSRDEWNAQHSAADLIFRLQGHRIESVVMVEWKPGANRITLELDNGDVVEFVHFHGET